MLYYEAKRRPDIQELIERAATLSDQDIAEVVVPLKWYRDALTQLRNRLIFVKDDVVLKSRYETSVNFQMGEICTYDGPTTFLPFESGDIQIDHGDLIFTLDDGIWYDHLFSTHKEMFPRTSTTMALKKDYREARQQQLASRHGLVNGESVDNSTHVYVDSAGTEIHQRRITSSAFQSSPAPVMKI